MFTRKRIIIAAIIVVGIPALVFAWWLLSPLFISTTVDEEFPLASAAVVPANMTMAEAEQAMMDAASAPDTMSDEDVPAEMAMPGDSTQMDASVMELKSGSFRDADSFHKGSGQATIYQAADGEPLLRLSDFKVTNGPDLHVLLVPHANPQSRSDIDGYIGLGSLKGNMGNQNYFLPDDADPADYGSVVIYCMPFHVIFSVATLE